MLSASAHKSASRKKGNVLVPLDRFPCLSMHSVALELLVFVWSPNSSVLCVLRSLSGAFSAIKSNVGSGCHSGHAGISKSCTRNANVNRKTCLDKSFKPKALFKFFKHLFRLNNVILVQSVAKNLTKKQYKSLSVSTRSE